MLFRLGMGDQHKYHAPYPPSLKTSIPLFNWETIESLSWIQSFRKRLCESFYMETFNTKYKLVKVLP